MRRSLLKIRTAVAIGSPEWSLIAIAVLPVQITDTPPAQWLAQHRSDDGGPTPLINPDRFQQETPTSPKPAIPPSPPPTPAPPTDLPAKVRVERIQVLGSTVFTEADWQEWSQPLLGQTVAGSELQTLAERITALYLERGYITSRAIVDPRSLASGNILIQVIEGGVERIDLEGAERLEEYVRSRVSLGTGTPLNTAELESQLRLLQVNPLIESISASLRAGTKTGQSILIVRVKEADPFSAQVSIDNYSPPSIGATRLNLDFRYGNVTGLGDAIVVSYRPRLEAFTGSYRVEAGYEVPLNPMNGSLAFQALIQRNEVIEGNFTFLDIQGESDLYTFTYRQPIIRTPVEEFALSLGFNYQTGQTFTIFGPTPFGFGPDELGRTSTSVIVLGTDYTRRDSQGAWALRSQLRFGSPIFDATNNPGSIPDSAFFSWLNQIQRLHILGKDNLLIAQLDFQLTPDPLLPSEQFVIGGGQSVRGYRQNVLGGDNGFRLSVEDRIILVRNEIEQPVFTLAPFIDMGAVWNASDNPNPIFIDSNFIIGIGLGLIWQPIAGLTMRIDYAPPLVNLNVPDNNVQDSGFYFSIGYNF